MAKKNIEKAGETQEKYYDRNKRYVVYNVGDEIMRRSHVLSDATKKFNKKLEPKYEGPFKIVEVKSPTMYILDSAERESRRLAMIHASKLKRYVPPCNTNSGNIAKKFFFWYVLGSSLLKNALLKPLDC